MDDDALYDHVLNLEWPWFDETVTLDAITESVYVSVALEADAQSPCYDSRPKQWRLFDTCQLKTMDEADLPHIKCHVIGSVTVAVPRALERSRFTKLFDALFINWLNHASTLADCDQFDMSWNAVDGIMQRADARSLVRRTKRIDERIAVDRYRIIKID